MVQYRLVRDRWTERQTLARNAIVNMLMTRKYADDTHLLVPSTNTQSIPQELQHISEWASANNLNLNKAKSQEMIFYLPRKRRQFATPTTITGINHVDKLNILGVTVSNTLTFSHHVTALIKKCARTLYALKTIRGHGLAGNALFDVARSTMVAQLLYASPALSLIHI